MKRKMIFGIITGAVLIFFGIALYEARKLQTIEITSAIYIPASQEQVYKTISHFRLYPQWSPFLAADKTQQYAIKGTDGSVGVQYHWKGNNGNDVGYQEITALEADRVVSIGVHIEKPFKAAPVFDYKISRQGNTTLVEQRFRLQSGLADAFFLWILKVKPEMAATNQRGLELLKIYIAGQE